MNPTDIQIAQGDATTIPEETAFAAYQTLREARTNPELAASPALATSREALNSYVTERRKHGHDLFPNVTAAANRERNDSLAGLYTKPLDKALPEKAYADLTRKMEFVPDPEAFKMREINRTYLSATVGQAIPPEKYDTIRTIYAKQHLGLSKDTSEAAVFTAIKTRFDEEIGSTEKLREIAKGEFDAILGGTLPTELPDLSTIPERLRPQVSDQILTTRRQSKERIRQVLPAVRSIEAKLREQVARTLELGEPSPMEFERIATELPRDPARKEIAIALLAKSMSTLPEQEKGAFTRLLTSISRGTGNAAAAALRAPLEAGAAIRNQLPTGAEQQAIAADNLTIRTDAENLRKAFLGEVDPLRKAGDNLAIQSLVLAGESLWTIPATLAGPIGWGAMASSFAGNSFQDARTADPEGGAGAQMAAAAISGPLQAGAEVFINKLGFKIIGGKLPGLAGILNKSGVFNPIARGGIAAATSAALIGTIEYAEEAVQGGIDRLAQDLALEFSNIAPDTDWKGFWGDWLTVGGAEQRDTLLAVLPFAVVGAGGASFQHFRYGSQLAKNRTVLDAIGVPSAVVDEMVNTTDVKKTDELFRQAWETGLEERTAEQKAAALDVMREINSLTAAAGLDRITRDSEFTYTYTDPLTRQSQEFETEEEALLHWRQQALSASQTDLDTIALTSREDLLNFLTSEGKASEETMIDEQERTLTLPQAVKEGIASPEQIESRVRIFILQNGLTPSQAVKEVESLTIRARSYTNESRDGQYRYAVQLFKNADPLDVFEDFAEDSIKRAFDNSLADPRRILRDIRTYEGSSNTRLIAPDYEYDPENTLPLVEGFSALARALVIGNARADLLPPAVSQWIEVAATYGANTIDLARSAITADLQRAGELKKALASGNVPTDLVSRLEDAIGINETEVLRRLEKKHHEQLAAEAMGGFPEIRDMAEGRIPHPETLRKNQHPLAGEVRRIWDSLKKPTRRRDKQGRTIDRTNEANAYFLPLGQMADIDKLRENLNEKGFDFQTPADLLDALESSLSYNKPVYATGSRGNDSFAVSPNSQGIVDSSYLAAVQAGDIETAQRMVNEAAKEAGYDIGEVYHGTASNFNAFDNKKTGRNDRGLWGLGHYFANSLERAKSYAERQGDGARVISAFISLKNPLILKTGSDLVIRLPDGTNTRELIGQNLDGSKIKAIALEGGHDGVIQLKPNGEIGDLVVYSPNQIKSADPVTYDEAGNVIPITQRFNPQSDSISFSIGRTTVTPSASTQTFQGQDGQTVIGPASFSIAPDYGINHRPNDDGPRAHDLTEQEMTPADVYEHPEWYSAMGKKVIAETMRQLRAVKGKAEALLTIYRAGPVGEMNPGDWVSLSKDYARTHADAQDPEGYKVWEAKVKAQDVRWAMDDLAEFGYFGEKSEATESNVSFSIGAWHGTPHKVDKFSTDKIGTGEGAQAYGWGLYFAESVDVAKEYKEKLATISYRLPAWQQGQNVKARDIAKIFLEAAKGDIPIAQSRLAGSTTIDEKLKKQAKELLERITDLEIQGNLYRVTLKVEEADLLEWDKPFAEQSEPVKAAIIRIQTGEDPDLMALLDDSPDSLLSMGMLPNIKGSGAYKTLSEDPAAASRALAAAGIRGIRFLDGNSRNSQGWHLTPPSQTVREKWMLKSADPLSKGIFFETEQEAQAALAEKINSQTYNYVIFDGADIEILEENGQPVELGSSQPIVDSSFSIGSINFTPGGGSKQVRIEDTTIDFGISSDGQTGEIILVKTPRDKRRQGSARKALTEFIQQADRNGLTLFLTPEPMDKGVSKSGLEELYRLLGFRKNKGRAKDFRSRASMVREPKPSVDGSFSLGPAAFARLEQAIAAKMTAAPDERAEYYSRVRDRLAATQQRLEDMDNGVGAFARQPTDEAGEERRRIQDAIAEARAIIGALPPDARGRVEMDFEDITSKTTEKGKVKALLRLMDKADIALEKVLQSAYLESITRVLDLAQPDLRQNRSVRGRLTPETQRLINAILPLTRLTPIEASAEQIAAQASFDALDNQFPDPEDDAAVDAWERSLAAAQERLDLIDTFASLSTQTSAELAAARKHLLQIYTKGRTARQMLDQAKRSEVASERREVIESLGGLPSQSKWKKRVDDKGFLDRMEGYRLGLVSFHEMMEWLFPNSIAARDYQRRVRDAERSVSRARIDARQRWENFAFTALNLTGRSRKRRLNRIIADLSTARTDWNIEIAEGRRSESVKMSEEQAASILDGTLKPGWETDLIAMESLRQALADFRMKRKAAQDQDKAFQGKVIRFERVTQRGAPTFLRMSDMEAVYYLQLAAQSQYLPALDKYGFTGKVLNQIRAKIDPRATTIMSHLRGEYDMQYQRLNPVHQRLFGLDMPQIRNYAPGAFESMDGKQDPNISPDGTGGALSAMSAGFTKARTHHMARPRQANALALYWSSLEQTEHFIAWAEVMRDMRQIFRSPDVRRTLEAAYGSRAGAEFSTWLDILETDGRSRAAESLSLTQTFNQILTAQSAIGLAFNIGTIFKQWSAGIGHFMLMPTGAAIKASYKAITSPKTLRDVWNSEAIQQRIKQGISPEDRRLLEAANASPSLAMELLEMGRLPISLADGAFTTLMGASAYRYQYDEATKNGLPDSQAHTAALAHMDMVITRTAQPATTQDKSLAENTARGFGKALFLFKSDPRQKFAMALTAIRLATRGDLKTPEAIRRVFFSWALYGLMAQIATDMWRAISRDDDDLELWQPKDYIAAMIAGPLAGVPILGSGLESAIRSLVGSKAYTNNANPIDKAASMLFRDGGFSMATITAMGEEDVDLNEILIAATRDAGSISQLLAVISPATAIVPAGLRAVRDVVGIGSNVIGAFSGDTPEDIAARIVREEKEADKKPAENRKQQLDTLAKEISAMPSTQREKRLRQLDKDTRTSITSRLRKADMTPSERSLASLPAAARAKAITRILAELPEQERKPYMERMETLGLAD